MGHIWLCALLLLLNIFLFYGHSQAKPKAVLSPQWLSPGASVTLSCEVKESSADWRFYWYRAVPTPSNNPYTYELLPGSLHGTVEGSYIIHGPTGTGGYVCKAGRGDPVSYTEYSEPQFVWSGDLHFSASLTVSSNRTQHFSSESVSLSCEGKSTDWKVKSFYNGLKGQSQSSEPMTRYTWDVVKYKLSSAVYWCESGLGEYSNAVNITVHSGSVILVSPVHPVNEGHSVTLQCKYTDSSFSNVDFYRNEELVQDETNGEMIIPAVSKSDEGFYKCKYSGGESLQSWMAVTLSVPVEESSPVGLIVGLVVVILLTILLLLLCRYRTSKDHPCCVRSRGTNQNSAADRRTNQRGSPDDGHAPLQHDEPAAESTDATYSQIELKYMDKEKKDEPEAESSDATYSQIELKYMDKKNDEPAAESSDATYSQIELKNMDKEKKDEPAAESSDATYSQIELKYMDKEKTG